MKLICQDQEPAFEELKRDFYVCLMSSKREGGKTALLRGLSTIKMAFVLRLEEDTQHFLATTSADLLQDNPSIMLSHLRRKMEEIALELSEVPKGVNMSISEAREVIDLAVKSFEELELPALVQSALLTLSYD